MSSEAIAGLRGDVRHCDAVSVRLECAVAYERSVRVNWGLFLASYVYDGWAVLAVTLRITCVTSGSNYFGNYFAVLEDRCCVWLSELRYSHRLRYRDYAIGYAIGHRATL